MCSALCIQVHGNANNFEDSNKHPYSLAMLHNLQVSIGSRAIATCARSPTRSGRMVDDPEDVLTDRNVRPNKETAEDVVRECLRAVR